jgi:hypothetical protein
MVVKKSNERKLFNCLFNNAKSMKNINNFLLIKETVQLSVSPQGEANLKTVGERKRL